MDNLIQTPGGGLGGGSGSEGSMRSFTRTLATIVLVLSGLVLVGTAVVDCFFPKEIGRPVGQEARDIAEAKRNRRLRDGSLAKGFETRLRLRSRVRQSLAPYWSAVLLKTFNVVPSDLIAGKEGWLFLRDRVISLKSTRRKAVVFTGGSLAAIHRRLGIFGSELIIMPVPRKSVACASMLPDGLNPHPEFERDLVQELRARGLFTIDAEEAWEGLPPHDRYLRMDSHWANQGIKSLADAVAEIRPELVTGELELSLRERAIREPARLLSFAAIPSDHPVYRWVIGGESHSLSFKQKGADNAMKDPSSNHDVAIVGSSFTKNFSFARILAVRFGRPVYPGGLQATPFAGSLAGFATKFSGIPYPEYILYEFPTHQGIQLGAGNGSVRRSLGSFFSATSDAAIIPVPVELLRAANVAKKLGRGSKLAFASGVLLSTGDGVLQLRIRVAADAKSKWELRSTGPALAWTSGSGVEDVVIPIIQTEATGQPVRLVDLEGIGEGAVVEVEVVTDVDLSNAVELPLDDAGPNAYVSAAHRDLSGPNGAAVVQWEGRPQAIRIVIAGVDAEGNTKRIEAAFAKPQSQVALLSLTPLGLGSVDSIRIEGDMGSPKVSLASQLSNR